MGGFFSLDGPFYRFGSMLFDVIMLSLLWLICSIPIFTIGASTTAVFYVTTRKVSGRERYLASDFFKSFKESFVQSTLSWLLILFSAFVLYINVSYCLQIGNIFLLAGQFFIGIEMILICLYLFPIISRFNMKFFTAFKSAFFMANKHIFTSISCLVLAISAFFVSIYTVLFMFIAMGAYAYLTSFMFVRIFRKYRPELDSDTIEDRPLNIKVDEDEK